MRNRLPLWLLRLLHRCVRAVPIRLIPSQYCQHKVQYWKESTIETLESLMQEPPGGHNHGRRTAEGPSQSSKQSLTTDTWQRAEVLQNGGLVERGTAHRGVLFDGEYVDAELLRELVAAELGYTYEQIRSVYRQGGPRSPEARELRGKIDAAMLALSRDGGNMTQLGQALGLDDNVIKSAIRRAA